MLGHTVFEGHKTTVSHLLSRAIKLFFSTSPRTLSPRFDSAPVNRDQVYSISSTSVQNKHKSYENITVNHKQSEIRISYLFLIEIATLFYTWL